MGQSNHKPRAELRESVDAAKEILVVPERSDDHRKITTDLWRSIVLMIFNIVLVQVHNVPGQGFDIARTKGLQHDCRDRLLLSPTCNNLWRKEASKATQASCYYYGCSSSTTPASGRTHLLWSWRSSQFHSRSWTSRPIYTSRWLAGWCHLQIGPPSKRGKTHWKQTCLSGKYCLIH